MPCTIAAVAAAELHIHITSATVVVVVVAVANCQLMSVVLYDTHSVCVCNGRRRCSGNHWQSMVVVLVCVDDPETETEGDQL